MAQTWTSSDPRWAGLTPFQKAAAMALMEADGMNPQAARNALGAMINRAAKTGADLGDHVGQAIYQPAIEPKQQARLDRILNTNAFHNLTTWAQRRAAGIEPDPVSGATHFLAPESVMLALERQNPSKYKNWGPRGANWTGYDPATGSYRDVVMRDSSHAFLAPEGAHSVPTAARVNVAQNGAISGGQAPQASPLPTTMVATAPQAQPVAIDRLDYSAVDSQPEATPQVSTWDQMAANSQAAIPKLAPQQAMMPMRQPVDVSRLLQIISNRNKLGVA